MSIGHYENPHLVVEWHRELPEGTGCEPLRLVTPDRAMAPGWLYWRGDETTAVLVAHPRADFARHYTVPGLVERGFAVLTLNTRFAGNPTGMIHEAALVDVAAAVTELRRRFARIVLLGNSGGGSLLALYQHQATAPEGERLVDTPDGRPYDLNAFEMPPGDLFVALAAHPGEGHHLLHSIDPSVTDEADPRSCDPAFDMYDQRNGFAEPPDESRYDRQFVDRYRRAQRRRVERLDEHARADVERRRAARGRWRESGDPDDRREATAVELLTVYRTDADPRCTDLSLDPSERTYGSLWGTRPDWTDYGPVGLARVQTPEAWLSTWSGLSSRAALTETGSRVTVPCLHVSYTADHAIFPTDADLVCRSLGTDALTRLTFDADHYGFPEQQGREPAVAAIADWIDEQ